jgi:hypothetical protein
VIMAKFIPVQVPTERYTGNARDLESYFVNVDSIRCVVQNMQNSDRSSILFIGSERSLQILESAANFVNRVYSD